MQKYIISKWKYIGNSRGGPTVTCKKECLETMQDIKLRNNVNLKVYKQGKIVTDENHEEISVLKTNNITW